MKKMLVMSSLVFATVLQSIAVEAGIGETKKRNTGEKVSGESKTAEKSGATVNASRKSLSAVQRAGHLTDRMIRDLKLNNYQARTLRQINLDKVNQMMAIEAAGGDATQIDNDCKGVCKDRDKELENVLSTEQYSIYFSNRPTYYKFDKDYANGGFLENATSKVEKDNLADNDDDESTGRDNTVASR
ncbi:hypothetical protein I5M27_12425 [Adhaeribacter sp. BT258]|uniref:Uncharacterized protein n=1 Tax=Adhaeribacter terrigena TaxID=2793070 RepID=A0ABS1C323_9BACT|nr:hypothetical protein [Adhaeribacter terrigena]MBK0403797.1 hypothetical protein [Adhaeribacter terrigena]